MYLRWTSLKYNQFIHLLFLKDIFIFKLCIYLYFYDDVFIYFLFVYWSGLQKIFMFLMMLYILRGRLELLCYKRAFQRKVTSLPFVFRCKIPIYSEKWIWNRFYTNPDNLSCEVWYCDINCINCILSQQLTKVLLLLIWKYYESCSMNSCVFGLQWHVHLSVWPITLFSIFS